MVNILGLFTLTVCFLVILVMVVLLGNNTFHQRFPAVKP
jgi:hypothetical protein